MRLAFFDLDKTLYDGFSLQPFVDYLVSQNPNHSSAIAFHNLRKEYDSGKLNYNEATRKALELTGQLAKGYEPSQLEQAVAKIFSPPQPFFSWVKSSLDFLRAHDFSLYIISGSPDLVVTQLASQIGIDHWFATQLLLASDGTYSGEIELMNHNSKLIVLEEIIASLAEKHQVVAFGDSPGNIPMLKAADLGFVIAPDHQLEMQSEIEQNSWVLLQHETAEEQVKKAVFNLLKEE